MGVELDVREDLRAGREPFQKIMAVADNIPVGSSFVLYTTFKPTPLLAILGSQGFESEATALENGDWRIMFSRTRGVHQSSPEVVRDSADGSEGGNQWRPREVVLDNRGLEPPEPMVRTLEAINTLQPGERIVGYFDRRPMFLLPKLEQMGFTYEVTSHEDGSATVTIIYAT